MREADGNAIIMTGISSRAMLLATAVALCFGPSGCDKQRREKEAAAFGQQCGLAGFNPEQCAFLYDLRQDSRDRTSESEAFALVRMNTANAAAINASGR